MSPPFFIDNYYSPTINKSNSFLIYTPFPTILYLSNQRSDLSNRRSDSTLCFWESKSCGNTNAKNVSENEIKQFIEKIKKHSFKPIVENIFEDL